MDGLTGRLELGRHGVGGRAGAAEAVVLVHHAVGPRPEGLGLPGLPLPHGVGRPPVAGRAVAVEAHGAGQQVGVGPGACAPSELLSLIALGTQLCQCRTLAGV